MRKRIEERVEFLGPQDGPAERELIAAVRPLLQDSRSVERAYLTRVGFAPTSEPSVAMCIAPRTAERTGLVSEILDVFKRLFVATAFLDVIFLTAEQELDVQRVCKPFYDRDSDVLR